MGFYYFKIMFLFFNLFKYSLTKVRLYKIKIKKRKVDKNKEFYILYINNKLLITKRIVLKSQIKQ